MSISCSASLASANTFRGSAPAVPCSWLPGGCDIQIRRSAIITSVTFSERAVSRSVVTRTRSRSDSTPASAAWRSARPVAGLTTSSAAAISSAGLSGKTRKMVPSAIPAASAICRVVTSSPFASSSGTTASTMARRRSSGAIGVARPERRRVAVMPATISE